MLKRVLRALRLVEMTNGVVALVTWSLVQITSHGEVYEITDYKQDGNLPYVR